MDSKARHFFSKFTSPFYLFLIALLVRLFYLMQLGESPFAVPPPGLDPALYHELAQSIAEGKGLGKDILHTMPLYPQFLGIIYVLTKGGLFWGKLIQLVLGAVSVLMIYAIGTKLFDPLTGKLAAFGQAFSGISIFYEAFLVPASIISFLFILSFFLVLRTQEKSSFWDWIWVGLSIGLTALTHAGILLFLPFLVIWIVRRHESSFLKRSLSVFMVLGCVFVFLFSVFLRNLWVAKEPILFTAHGGINFYIGNHSGATGRFQSLFAKHTSSRELLEQSHQAAEESVGRPLQKGEASRFWFRKGLEFIRESPGEYGKLLLKKVYLFWNGYEIPDIEDYYFFRSRFSVLKFFGIPFSWIAPFGLLGVCLGIFQLRRHFLLYGFFLSQMGAILLFFVNSRYRAPLVPWILIFAAFAMATVLRFLKERKYQALFLSLLVGAVFVVVTHLPVGATSIKLHHYNVGIALSHAGEYEAAIEELQTALSYGPQDSVILFALANAYFYHAEHSKAKQYYEDAIRYNPRYADAYFNIGLIDYYEGRFEKAEAAFQHSIALKPQGDVYYLLYALYRKMGRLPDASKAKQEALRLGVDPRLLQEDPMKRFKERYEKNLL